MPSSRKKMVTIPPIFELFLDATYQSPQIRFLFFSCQSNWFGRPKQPNAVAIMPLVWKKVDGCCFNINTLFFLKADMSSDVIRLPKSLPSWPTVILVVATFLSLN